MRITYFQRKPMDFHFSIEKLFNTIRNNIDSTIKSTVIVMPYYSKGLTNRLLNCFFAFKHQGEINHNTGDIYYASIFLKKSITVTTYHDFTFLRTNNRLKYSILKLFWVTLPVKRSQIITAISETTKNELIELTHCDPSKIVVIPNIIDIEIDMNHKIFDQNCPNILQIGTTPNKNLERVITAIRGLKCTFHVVGRISTEIELMLNENNIHYVNYFQIPESSLKKLYEQTDILLFCSLNEGFGMPILEAQAMGVPIITSEISSMPEVAGKGAILVNPLNPDDIRKAVITLIQNSSLREQIVSDGYQNITRFSPKAVCQAYETVYKSLLPKEQTTN